MVQSCGLYGEPERIFASMIKFLLILLIFVFIFCFLDGFMVYDLERDDKKDVGSKKQPYFKNC